VRLILPSVPFILCDFLVQSGQLWLGQRRRSYFGLTKFSIQCDIFPFPAKHWGGWSFLPLAYKPSIRLLITSGFDSLFINYSSVVVCEGLTTSIPPGTVMSITQTAQSSNFPWRTPTHLEKTGYIRRIRYRRFEKYSYFNGNGRSLLTLIGPSVSCWFRRRKGVTDEVYKDYNGLGPIFQGSWYNFSTSSALLRRPAEPDVAFAKFEAYHTATTTRKLAFRHNRLLTNCRPIYKSGDFLFEWLRCDKAQKIS
jgi:hypothetical protein